MEIKDLDELRSIDELRAYQEDVRSRITAINAESDGLPLKDDGKPRSPRPDANQGRSGAGGPKSTADSFAEFFRNNLSER